MTINIGPLKKISLKKISAGYPVPVKILKEMAGFEADLENFLKSAPREIAGPVKKTLKAGGKRLRPALLLLSGRAGKYKYSSLRPAALAVEVIHMASLVHDDVLDRAAVRRGVPTIYKEYGAAAALSSGDHLFALSFIELCRTGDPRVLSRMADVAKCLSMGELDEIIGDRDEGTRAYIKRVFNKTAYLFSASCELGALISGAATRDVKACAEYGKNLGIAFQIYDDVLDITGTDKELGKSVGTDIRQGTLSLPVILALKDRDLTVQYQGIQKQLKGEPCGRASGAAIEEILGTNAEIAGFISSMKDKKIDLKAKKMAQNYLAKGDSAVQDLSNRSLIKNFEGISKFVIGRYN